MTGKNNDTIIKMKKLDNLDNYYIEKFEENKYGIMYYSKDFDDKFLDVYDCLTQNFLYIITDINGSSIQYVYNLKDGTLYVKTINNNSYIIKIIEDKGYQILYNIEIKGY